MDDWRAVVERDDVDAVDICTPNALHAPIAVAAAAAGKHVLVEKPIACTVAEADEMLAAARAAGVLMMTAHNLRFFAPFVAARETVAAGAIGTVTAVRAAFGHAGPRAWSPTSDWFFDPVQAGGGALLDLGIHMADLVRAVVADEVTEVAAMLTGQPDQCEDAAVVLLRFASGATGTLHASWIARPGPDHQLTVFGTAGTLHLDARTPLTLLPGEGEATRVPLPAADALVDPYAAFVDAVTTGAPMPVTGEDGRAALAIVEAAYRAAAAGTTVAVG